MGAKDFGPQVSGVLDLEGRNFESVIFQAGKPVLDKELNLGEDVSSDFALGLARRLAPSGWLTTDHLNRTDPVAAIFQASVVSNLLLLANNLQANVNGWSIKVAHTGNTLLNQVDLGPAPSGAAAKRTDLVILEVWRKLISAAPSTDGKSPGGRIWRNGNVKIQASDDVALNFVDDLKDATLNAESTKRVQLQYRLRVIPGVDLFGYPTGIDDPVVVANTVPASAGSPNGTTTAFLYQNQSGNGDPGLWRAGDGDPSNTLGTVDGFMYAIPLVAVFRRNSTAFAKNTNHNGAVAYPGPSDRPDGLFHDVVALQDVADLRQATSMRGWENYVEIGERNFNALLDNTLKTEWEITPNGGGMAGHTVLSADEIGTLPGDASITGDTPGATFIGQFDYTRRFFSDRSTYEVMTYKVQPGDAAVSTGTWTNGTTITIDASTISPYPFTSFAFNTRAPTGTRVLDIVGARLEGTLTGDENADLGIIQVTAPSTSSTVYPVTHIEGLGDYPGIIVITLGTPPAGASTEPIYLDLLIAYPGGCGLAKTPTADYGTSSFAINNPGTLPASFAAMQTQTIDWPHREVQLQYRSNTSTFSFASYSTLSGATVYRLPERVHALVAVRVNGTPLPGVGGTVDASGRILTMVGGSTNPGQLVEVDYQALRPMPQSGVQMTIYYQSRAAQPVRSDLLGTSQTLIPRWISPFLYSITAGSGTGGDGYPFPYAYVQTGGIIKNTGGWSGEHELKGFPDISIADFGANSGLLKLPALIPCVPNPDEITFLRSPGDSDIENRSYFPTLTPGYKLNAFAQSLSDEKVHKVVLPMLMESTTDSTLGRKGTLFLVLLTRWAESDAENAVRFVATGNTTTASIFRLFGSLLNRRS